MYIYKITNLKNNKVYIGQTIRKVEERFKRHINDAIHNILDTHFARAIRKYGKECFKIEIIDSALTQDELNIKEQMYIRQFNSIKEGYNETDALYKCGGNTYASKSNSELSLISNKIRKTKIGTKNPNHKKVKVRNEETKEELFFDTVLDCQKYFNEKTHRFITTRVNGETKSLYKKLWNIAYANENYFNLTKNVIRKTCNIKVINIIDNNVLQFNSIRSLCKELKINSNKIQMGKNTIIGMYKIEFK